ncbi:transcriptional repressor ILP1-like [Phoenix dactylifera]|uniref:Transcriptional repressor ILP1-like n=1 Tax=Phoenix dactylifera TaxID=42345 RepID=A0A8B8ZXK0_PHODC|nr:transcriptional repressor ILP1-like [Phoenix dactylifera]
MSSRAKNFRRRSDNGDAHGEEKSTPTPAAATNSSSASATSKSQTLAITKPKSSKPEGPKRLSFADDEEEDGGAVVAPRRPSKPVPSIHKLSSAKERSKISSLAPHIPSNVQPQTGEYTKERLLELQKNARPLGSMPRPKPSPSFSEPKPQKKPDPPAEPVIILKGLVKPVSTTTPGQDGEKGAASKRREDEEEEEEDGMDEDEERRDAAEKGRKLPPIPDRATIDAIRAKRAQLQQPRRPAPDYISLEGDPLAGGSSDEEENDFEGRVALFGGKMDGRPKKAVFEGVEGRVAVAEARIVDGGYGEVADDGDDDEDEEERKWEEEQFRKGLGRRIDEASTQRGVNSIPTIPPIQPKVSVYSGGALQSSMSNISLGPASIGVSRSAEVMSIPQQAEVATRALQENISRLKETHNISMNSLVRTDTQLSEALSEITSLERSLKAADEKYVFMQQLRDFISVMCDFLHDKAYFIEELEEQMQKLHEQRALAVVERRAADIADEANEVEAAVNAAISVLNKGSSAAYISAATTAAQAAAAAARENSNLSVELDEFGRDVNLQKRMEFTQRTEARKRRKVRSESKRMSSIGKDNVFELIEGEASTDESDSENSAYESSRNELLQAAEQIFSDASEEYSSLKIVKERFERWKNQYSSAYRDAYVSLTAPTIFSPFVRLELLKWDPLYGTTDFFDMEWHKLLFNYGLPVKDHDFDPDDADANLIPELVEKVALPILQHEIAHCWDMLSTQMTKNAVFATNMAINYVPASSKAVRELLAVVHSRLAEAITNLSVPVWGTVVTNAVPGAAQIAANRFGMSVRLLRNICLWKNILALPVLEKLALEELLRGKLLPHVRSIMSNIHDAITRTERIVASLSGVWSGLGITVEPSQKLRPLVDCIAELGSKLERRQALGVSEEETRGLARRLKNVLVALHEYDKARAMLRTFQLKEAL